MDTYTYMTSLEGHKYRALWSNDDQPAFHPRHRQRDVSKGTPRADISRALGQHEYSRCTGESFEEWQQRQQGRRTGEATP